MNLVSLYSGGKDSTYSIFVAKNQGHTVKCLLTAIPKSDESLMLHHPNIRWSELQAQSMQLPQVVAKMDSEDTGDEIALLEQTLLQAKEDYGIDGMIHGGISSRFQKTKFDDLCDRCGLEALSPLWGRDPVVYMEEILDDGFEYLLTSVSSDGLDGSWLGKTMTKKDLRILADLSIKYRFNLDFEGGEAETFVTDCPLFSSPIQILRGTNHWDGYRGRFEIVDAVLSNNA